MSLSNPKPQNPCKKFIEFKGDSGIFQYWDKSAEKNVKLEYPVQFIVLDELSTISGYSEDCQSGIYSNEIHNLKTQTLNVKSFKGRISIIGKYADIKGDVVDAGGKFCKSVYAGLINGNNLELVNFQLKGASFSGWVDKVVDVAHKGVRVEKCLEGKKGKVVYQIPVFEEVSVDRALIDKAIVLDKTLQAYLSSYQKENEEHEPFNRAAIKPCDPKNPDMPAPDLENDDIPF